MVKQNIFESIDNDVEIWSSSPLYSDEMKRERVQWFKDFKSENDLNAQSLWKFHHTAGNGDKNTNLIMDRGFVKTKSITQIIKTSEKIRMIYEDLDEDQMLAKEFN